MKESKKDTSKSFEEAMAELEEIVRLLEKGDASLEESMKIYTDGIALSRFCSKKIDSIEHKIEQLVKDSSGNNHEVEFES